MATAVALLPDRHAQATLAAAMRGRGRAVFCGDATALLAAVGRERPDVVVVALRDLSGAPTAPLIRAVRDGFATVTIVGYCEAVTPATARDVMLVTHAGVGDLVVRGERDDLEDLRVLIDGAARGTLAARVVRDLADVIPSSLAPLFRYCLANAHRPLGVEDVADAMAVHRKTLAYRLEQAGLPAPSAVAGWCRLALAAQLMEDPARSTEQIAAALEFPSGAALRNMLMRYTGLRPRDVRARGGVACVLDALRRALVSRRSDPGPPTDAPSSRPESSAEPSAEVTPGDRPRAGPERWSLRAAAAVLWGVAAGLGQFAADLVCA